MSQKDRSGTERWFHGLSETPDNALLNIDAEQMTKEEFGHIEADAIIIVGSWAARKAGIPGPMPYDIDILVVSDDDLTEKAQTAAQRMQARIKDSPPWFQGVQVFCATAREWLSPDSPFTKDVQSKTIIPVVMSGPHMKKYTARIKTEPQKIYEKSRQQCSEMSWPKGRDTMMQLINEGRIERIHPLKDSDKAMYDAKEQLTVAQHQLTEQAYYKGAALAAYESARQVCTVLLGLQGLRATNYGGHAALAKAVIAQFGGDMSPFSSMEIERTNRNLAMYGDRLSVYTEISETAATASVSNASMILKVGEALIDTGKLTTF